MSTVCVIASVPVGAGFAAAGAIVSLAAGGAFPCWPLHPEKAARMTTNAKAIRLNLGTLSMQFP